MKEINGQPHFITREVANRMNIKFNTFKNMLSNKGIFTGMYPTLQYELWFVISDDYVPHLKKTFHTTYWSELTIKNIYKMFNRPYIQMNPVEAEPIEAEPIEEEEHSGLKEEEITARALCHDEEYMERIQQWNDEYKEAMNNPNW